MSSDDREVFYGTVTIQPKKPLVFSVEEKAERPLSSSDRSKVDRIGGTIKAYRESAKQLIEGKYSSQLKYAPPQFNKDSTTNAFVLKDGIIIRTDLGPNPGAKIRILFNDSRDVTEMAPLLSESVVHCPRDPAKYDLGSGGVTFGLSKREPSGHESPIGSRRIAIIAPLNQMPSQIGSSTIRPVPLISIKNEFNLQILGEIFPTDQSPQPGKRQRFILENRVKLPVGWEGFEVYPPFDPDLWKAEFAPAWAEIDLLAAITKSHLKEQQLRAIDPNAEARKHFSSLFKEFEGILGGPEEPVHQFLKEHPEILSPTYIACWSKLSLGQYGTDFVFREPPNDYMLVELESPLRELFRQDGQEREELVHARNQVLDWQRYIEDNLSTVQREVGLSEISIAPRYMIVIGRSRSLSEENRRKLTTIQNQMPRLQILTYDDLLAKAKSVVENLLGPLWDAGGGATVYYLPIK